ncbi:MAG: CPBP family intramembrane glutamic endopeptidase [Bacteroidales bacterium]|jgi:membrane protease YdiL (CAAX protease family)|nr:CPBP family intramembrane glutamic endopeptidase [Bacteroidales bacterium]
MEKKMHVPWWLTLLYCIALIAIFFIVAIISDLATQWIPSVNLKFIVRELILRLPLTLFLMSLFAQKVIKMNRETFYLRNFTQSLFKWLLFGLVISIAFFILIVIFNPVTIMDKRGSLDSTWLIFYILSTIAMAINGGFLEETLFRGYILGLLKEKWNLRIAVLIPSVLFGIMHVTMLKSFHWIDFALLLIGGSLVGIMFSLIVVYSRNVFAAALVHMAWNMFFAGRILKVSSAPVNEINSIVAIHLENNHRLLNGGAFGIETSLLAILVYALVSMYLLFRIKSRKSSRL